MSSIMSNSSISNTTPSLEQDRESITDSESVGTSAASLPDGTPLSLMSGSSDGRAHFANPSFAYGPSPDSSASVSGQTNGTIPGESSAGDSRIGDWIADPEAPWNVLAVITTHDHTSTKTPSLADQTVEEHLADRNADDFGFHLSPIREDELCSQMGTWMTDYNPRNLHM